MDHQSYVFLIELRIGLMLLKIIDRHQVRKKIINVITRALEIVWSKRPVVLEKIVLLIIFSHVLEAFLPPEFMHLVRVMNLSGLDLLIGVVFEFRSHDDVEKAPH